MKVICLSSKMYFVNFVNPLCKSPKSFRTGVERSYAKYSKSSQFDLSYEL